MKGAGPLRVYADTSVFGGAFDEGFREPTRAFLEQVRSARFVLVTSVVVEDEIEDAPSEVRRLFDATLTTAEVTFITEAVLRLQEVYLKAGIVPARCADDALHVALATVAGCSAIVSWNFRHIVHFQKIALYNAVNEANGFRAIAIHSPSEVIAYEDQDL